jgi:molybdopterin synthase sulfur carrier subunit
MATSSQAGPCVRVRLFASLRDAMGWSEQLVTPDPGSPTPLALWHQLGLEPGIPPAGVRVAINQQFASWDAFLRSGDELAFLPPISGG